MEKIYKFTLPGIKPFSINKAYTKGKFTKTAAYRLWETQVAVAFRSVDAAVLREINAHINKFTAFEMFYRTNIPRSVYWTHEGSVSPLTSDLTNWEKPLQDMLFTKLYYANDLQVINMLSRKRPVSGTAWSIDVHIRLLHHKGSKT